MENYLAITIDTEADSPNWKPQKNLSLENIKEIPKLQELFQKYGARPTYLLTYSVVADEASREIFQEFLGKETIEVGAHLHPWVNPPFVSEGEKLDLSYPHRSKLEMEKLSVLTEKIEQSFGRRPLSYRAGRYGFDEESLSCLKKLGYRVDSSLAPYTDWRFDGGPDFSDIKESNPYFLNEKDIRGSGGSGVLEVPISIILNKGLADPLQRVYDGFPSQLKRAVKKSGLVKPVWLRPSISSFLEMKFVSERLLEKGINVLNMMFHSYELAAGKNPYLKTEGEVEVFFQKLENILSYLICDKKVQSKTLSEVYGIFKS